MKKQLLMAGFLLAGMFSVSAQSLQSDNFDSYTLGNLTQDVTGQNAGQGGWYAAANSGATPANFQIVTEGSGKALQIQGANNVTGTTPETSNTRYVWKGPVAWSTRTSGNNVFRVEFDLYTGGTTTSKNAHLFTVLNAQGDIVGGYQYVPGSKALIGLALKNTTEIQLIGLAQVGGQPAPATLPANTWVKLVLMINYNDGKVTFQIPSLSVNGSTAANNYYTAANAPAEFDFIAVAGTENTAASTIKIDNYTITAANSETAGVDNHLSQQFAMYPNPTTGIVNITNNENVLVSQVNVSDLNGRVVKTVKFENVSEAQVDISGLSAGMYIMNITTNQGTATKKVVKK